MPMVHFTFAIALTMQFLACTCCCSADVLDETDSAKFRVLMFSGATATEKFNGQFGPEEFSEWFAQDYGVGGERIETPSDAKHLGVMVVQYREDLILLPLCTWTDDRENKYFACQSGAIGDAPKFSVCIECKTVEDYLGQMRRKLAGLTKQGISLDQRAADAVAEIKRIREVVKMGIESEAIRKKLGAPNSIEEFDSSTIAETWRYDLDESVYFLVNYDSNGFVIGSGSSGVRELVGSLD